MTRYICKQCDAESKQWTGQCPTCGGTQAITLKPTTDPMEGRTVSGRYRILRKVGHGGMGSVYLAEQPGLGHKVALKFLNAALSQDESIARRFLNEARSYGLVAHPNAVALHDFGQDEEGNLFISMEYVEGTDLKKLLKQQGRLPVGEALDITLQLADVLAHAHAQKVVHRDMKPENVMVRRGLRGYHVKVLDFGIARILADGVTRLTEQGLSAGTPRYMSPEQVEGRDVDARADIYALGLVFFELLTGASAMNGTTVAEILHKQFHQRTPSLAEVVPELKLPALDTIIQKATAKDLAARYPSMEAFARDLQAVQVALGGTPPTGVKLEPTPVAPAETRVGPAEGGSDTVIPAISPVPKAGSPLRSSAMIAGAVALLGLGAAVVVMRAGGGEPPARPPAPVAPPSPGEASAKAEPPSPAAPGQAAVPGPAPAQEAKVAGLDGVDALRLQLLAEEIWARANAAFLSSDLDTARALLDTAPKAMEQAQPKLAQLRESITEVSERLKRAHAQAKAGDCSAAIKGYSALLKRYPHVREAKRGRAECQEMLPPSLGD